MGKSETYNEKKVTNMGIKVPFFASTRPELKPAPDTSTAFLAGVRSIPGVTQLRMPADTGSQPGLQAKASLTH